jgi:RNA 2'-phosphotransferase, Tpt1 / KptA family
MLRIVSKIRVPLIQARPPIKFASLSRSAIKRRRRRRFDLDGTEDPIDLFARMNKLSIYPKFGEITRGVKDSPKARNSKTLAWLLRHGAQSEGLTIRHDGYVKVRDLVSLFQLFEAWQWI